MSERATALAERFEQICADVVATVERCSDANWERRCTGEGWSVSVVAHHIASAMGPAHSFVETIARGDSLPPVTSEMLDEGNAKHAEAGSYSRAETLSLLREQGQAIAANLRRLTDEQLDRTGAMPLTGGQPMSAATMTELGLIGHPTGHLASIKSALGHAAA